MDVESHPFYLSLTFTGTPSRSLNDALNRISTTPIKPLMIGQGFMIIGVTWQDRATTLWDAIVKADVLLNVKEILILGAGSDWACGMDKPACGWLTRNVGNPRPME